jgi:diguanylate cyclase (GGDEF)-like protein
VDATTRAAHPIALSLPRPLRYAAGVVLLAAAYFAAAKLALLAAIPPGYTTAVWPPSGIALAAVLLFGNRVWPGIWLGAALVNVTVKASLTAALLMGTGNTLEALAGAALVRRYLGVPCNFERGEDVIEFVAIAALASAIAASVAAAPLALVHSLSSQALLWNWWTWWQGDAMGIVIVAPVILSWSIRGETRWSWWKIVEGTALTGTMLAITYAIFSDSVAQYLPSLPLTFAILPFVIWTALRFQQREVATVNALVSAIAVWFTLEGRGPFASAPLNVSLLLLLAFMSTAVTTGLVLNAVVGERARAIEALKRALRNLKEETIRDPLTGLYNRRFLGDYMRRELIRAKREGGRIAVIMVDLDRFKQINDTAGHAAGDLVLMEIATLLKRHIRGSDIACRYGGEEFTLVLPNATPESAHRKAEAIRSAIREDRDKLLEVTASLGIAFFPDHAADAESLLRAADEALYEAKRGGRNRVKILAATAEKPTAPREAGVKHARS